jgi:transcriptional regulator with XRE-family HTH domain
MGAKTRVGERDRRIGARLRERRLELGWTLKALATALGITYQQIHKYEAGINRMSVAMLCECAEVLGTPIAYFLNGAVRPDLLKGRDAKARNMTRKAELLR